MITPLQIQNVWLSWKSTLTGICSFIIVIIIAYTTLPPKAGHAVTALAVLRAIVDFLKKDAGHVEVAVPGGTATVPSHETPNDPNAKVAPPEARNEA